MLMPRKVAHRKHHRGRMRGTTKGGSALAFGQYGIRLSNRRGSPPVRSKPLVSP